MDKEKVLEMSRNENKNKDIFAKEAEKKATGVAVVAGCFIAVILYFWQFLTGNGENLAIVATVLILNAVLQWAMYFMLKKKTHIIFAIFWTIFSIIVSVDTIMSLYN